MPRCKFCGSSKDYIIKKEGKLQCNLCGYTWRRKVRPDREWRDKVPMSSVIFGLVASGLTAYNPTGDPKIIIALMILSISLLSFYFAYIGVDTSGAKGS